MVRPPQCLFGRHTWTSWKKHKDGCGTPGCDHYLRRCIRCPKWQHKLADGKLHNFRWTA